MDQLGCASSKHPPPRFDASTGGATYAVSSLSCQGNGAPDTSIVRMHDRHGNLETTQGMQQHLERLPWSGPDALVHTFLDRLLQQGCRGTGRVVPQTPTWNRQYGATAGSRACAYTDGSRHGPEHSDQRNQRLAQVPADRRTDSWPAPCVPQGTRLHQTQTAACRPPQLTRTDSAHFPSFTPGGDVSDSHQTDLISRARRPQNT